MSLEIKNTEDVYKYAALLFNYLSAVGRSDAAMSLSNLTDSCFSTDEAAVKAHRLAFEEIKAKVPDLPEDHLQAVHDSLRILS